MVIVVEVILNAAVAFVDLPTRLHGTLVRRFGGPQIVAERLHVKVQSHCADSHCWDRWCSKLHYSTFLGTACFGNLAAARTGLKIEFLIHWIIPDEAAGATAAAGCFNETV